MKELNKTINYGDLISIIIPVYNAEKYIEETIRSIESQTYKIYEAIFVDDCSNDKSIEIIQRYKNNNDKIKWVKLEKHEGVSKARNKGIELARGRYLTFLDADDIWTKDKLKKQIEFIKQNDYAFVYCNYRFISDDGKKQSREIKTSKKTDYNKALKNIRILTITAMIDIEKIPKEICYMPDVMNEDVATWWNILRKGYIAYGQNETLAYYRKTKNSRSSKKNKTAYYRWILYRKQENLKLFKAIYCFTIYGINGILKRISRMEKI